MRVIESTVEGRIERGALLYVPTWLRLTLLLPTLSVLVDLAVRGDRMLAWSAERWLVYAITAAWGYLCWPLAALVGFRLQKRANWAAIAWFTGISVVLALSLSCTLAYYTEAQQYPTWSEVVFLIEESSNVEGTLGLLRSKLPLFVLSCCAIGGASLWFWWAVWRRWSLSVARRWDQRRLLVWLTVATSLWLTRAAIPSMADAAPLLENAPVVAGMVGRYYLTRNRGVFHEAQRDRVPALAPMAAAPNVILVVHESLSRKALGLYGSAARTTPLLEQRVATAPNEWFVFKRAVTNSSNTSVSVPTILLGIEPGSSIETFHSVPVIWHYARAAGYQTGLLSAQSWHYAALDRFLLSDPPDRVWTAEPERGVPLPNGGGMDDEVFFTEVEQRLTQNAAAGKPFLEVIQFNATHFPFLERPDSGFDTSTRLGRYNGAVALLDSLMNRLVTKLDALGVGDNTVVLMTSDHGENHGEHAVHRTHSFYDEVLGIPFLMRVPAAVQRQRSEAYATLRAQLDKPTQNLDVVPTLLDVMGVLNDAGLATFRGRLSGQSVLSPISPDRVLLHQNVVPIRVWSEEGFALTRGDERYSFTEWRGDEWYDLSKDPAQTSNQAREQSALPPWVQQELVARPALAALRAEHCPHLSTCR